METVNKVCNGQLWALCPSTLMMMIIACKFFWKTRSVLKVIWMILHYLHTHHKCHIIHRKLSCESRNSQHPSQPSFPQPGLWFAGPNDLCFLANILHFLDPHTFLTSCFTSHCHTCTIYIISHSYYSLTVSFFSIYIIQYRYTFYCFSMGDIETLECFSQTWLNARKVCDYASNFHSLLPCHFQYFSPFIILDG